nr:putative amino-acid metabolite efflux pump [Cupriavidus sp.]
MHPTLRASFPAVFVLIWSTGFIVARYGMPHAEPLTFLSIRFLGVIALLLPMVWLMKAPWPDRSLIWKIAIAGVLLQAGYLGGVWAAVKDGMTAGLAALIVGLQPVITACLAGLVQERLYLKQWLGLLLGLLGVALVVWAKVDLVGLTALSIGLAVLALFSITAGTLYQKRACPNFDLRTGSLIQFAASAAVTLPFAFLFETQEVTWHPELIGALVWSVLALSIGAISLLFVLIREGAATQVTGLLYLTPPTTAVMAWALFDEPITVGTVLGMAATAVGVWMVMRGGPAPKTPRPEPR